MKKNILVIGLTSVRLGAMENANIGNYLIVEPLFSKLREFFPDSEIRTSLQMSDTFSKRHNLTILKDKRFWTYKLRTLTLSGLDLISFGLHKLLKNNRLIKKSIFLNQVYWSDIIVDFSGDLYGDNSPLNRFIEGSIKLLISSWSGKPVIMFASSPGPFRKNFFYKILGKYVLNSVKMIANREPRSSKYLIELGINEKKITNTACPSVLFDRKSKLDINDVFRKEGIDPKEKKIGIIITGWNMSSQPFNRYPRSKEEIGKFLPIIDFFIKNNHQVILLSHSNRVDNDGIVIHGPDSELCNQLISGYQESFSTSGKLHRIKKVYDPETIRQIIGEMDFLISGRLHAALSGLSQNIPTVILDYGFNPKGHKLLGIAELYKIERYFCDPSNPNEMYEKISLAWENRNLIKSTIMENNKIVKKLAIHNFELIYDLLKS